MRSRCRRRSITCIYRVRFLAQRMRSGSRPSARHRLHQQQQQPSARYRLPCTKGRADAKAELALIPISQKRGPAGARRTQVLKASLGSSSRLTMLGDRLSWSGFARYGDPFSIPVELFAQLRGPPPRRLRSASSWFHLARFLPRPAGPPKHGLPLHPPRQCVDYCWSSSWLIFLGLHAVILRAVSSAGNIVYCWLLLLQDVARSG